MSTCQKVDTFFVSSGHKNHTFITTVLSFFIIFAEDKLHSAIWKQAFIALAGIIFAEVKWYNVNKNKTIIYLLKTEIWKKEP